MNEASCSPPLVLYSKQQPGDIFNGLVFMEYASTAAAQTAKRRLEDQFKTDNVGRADGQRLWCNFERPADVRALISFLLGLKKFLTTDWKYNKNYFKFSDATQTLRAGGTDILKVSVKDGGLVEEWLDSTWGSWADLQQAPEVQKLRETTREKLRRSVELNGKGAGKGLS